MTAEEHAALQARQAQDEREAREGGEPATLQHVLAGRCGGIEPSANRAHLEELRRQLDQLRRGVRGGGPRLLRAAAVAYAGVAAALRGEEMSEAQSQAVQRAMCGILPEWEGTDLKQRSTQQQIVVRQLWSVAAGGAEFLQQWKVNSAAGVEWLRQREESREWLRLVVRAWREEVERHGARGERALPQHRWRVRWERRAAPAALVGNRSIHRDYGSTSRDDAEGPNAAHAAPFPNFPTTEAADHVHRRIRAATAYMRVTHRSQEEARKARKRRAEVLQAAETEAKRVAGEQRARELEERREAERRAREGRTEGPAARTRDGSTKSAVVATRGIEKQRGSRAKRRGPTHVCARVGPIVVGLLEQEYRPSRGDG